ncbi:MAG: PKD domain-containing protein, partial [Bacteroidia bacterium]|nr:PKD domain-containing protein [Bacteroidia bacterium]
MKIGVRYLLDGGYFNGSLDDIRIYNRALSEAEIQALYDTIPTLAPVADFTVNDSTVTAGSTVQFTDLSTNNPISWSWSFAGGTPSSSTLQNPSVTYNTAGTYDVTLIVANAAGSDTLTKTNYIEVNDTVPMVTFQKSYGTDGYEYGNTVHRTTDNGYIINGCTSASYANYYQNYVLKTDNSGTMLWSIKFGNIYSSNYRVVKNIIQTSDGGYIVAGSDCSTGVWFSKINSSGNIVWSKLFGGLCYPKQIINTPDGNYMIVSDNSITKIDTAFNILWAKSYNTPDYFFMNSVIPTNDNGYIVVASDYYGGAGQIDIS